MRLFSYTILILCTVYLCYGLSISRFSIKPIQPTDTVINTTNLYDYKGVINVHSQKGEGKGTIPEIIKAAYESKLDFIIFTENSSFDSVANSTDEYEENILVLNGREYSYLKSRLILIDPTFDFSQIKSAGDAHMFLSDYLEENREGFILLKHPTRKDYEWEGEFANGIDAIEIISLRSHWRESWENSKWNFITSLLMYPFNPEYAFLNIYRNPYQNLNLWYKINQNRKLIGLSGSDAKSKFKLLGNLFVRFPSYKQLFLLSSNHILLDSELTGQIKTDSQKVLKAISNGQFYFSLDFMGNPKGFNFYARKKNKEYQMGQTITKTNTELCFDSPKAKFKDSWAVLLKDGKKIFQSTKESCFAAKETGAYNLIYYRKIHRPWPFKSKRAPWIYSNFIYLK